MKSFTFNTSKSIVNEAGSLARIGDICRRQRISRPLVVTDGGIVALGMLDTLSGHLTSAGLPVAAFTDVVADPPEAVARQVC